MTTTNQNPVTTIVEPSILTANTYYWSPESTANGRRKNEERRTNDVANYLSDLGFEVTEHDSNNVLAQLDEIEVRFHYSESCKNVYKSLAIFKGGKKSNITALRKLNK